MSWPGGFFFEDLKMSFDQIIIHSSSHTFCNIKPGNLFFVKKEEFDKAKFEVWKEAFFKRGLMASYAQISDTSTAILVLNVCWVRKILDDVLVQSYLTEKGYHTISAFDFVEELFFRMKNNQGFPHEVGVILGYPVEDVIEFENHQGHDCKYCGCWKSYSDVDKARDCHCRFTECSRLCKKWYDEGYSINQIITKYQTLKTVA
jgi:hypothetical protein